MTAEGDSSRPVAIIDIGSNSVRLVVYSNGGRSPSVIFNEKLLAGLGRDLGKKKLLSEEAMARALAALERFALLIRYMGVGMVRSVATAAVREARNGQDFLSRVRELGFDPEVLAGKREAKLAGYGVVSAIPGAKGVVGDLGGGSLELVAVGGGKATSGASLPLGVLRIGPLLDKGDKAVAHKLAKALKGHKLARAGKARPLYLVGGSWRALSRLDMALTEYPLPVIHNYEMEAARAQALRAAVDRLGEAQLRQVPGMPSARAGMMREASAVLALLVEQLRPEKLVVSAFGLREGLLHDALPPEIKRLDPLIEATREAGLRLGRFPEHGALLDSWIAPAFDDGKSARRLRLAACLLSDIAWRSHPSFRAERGLDMALHGNWVGIDARGRAILAEALFANFSGASLNEPLLLRLASEEDLRRARAWGLAMRLAQRLSGGAEAGLEGTALVRKDGRLLLELEGQQRPLYGEPVERRHASLAETLGLRPALAWPCPSPADGKRRISRSAAP
ncbi:MAG: Ppx/GppA family phosphatase [Sphingomonadaceae bacterium]